MTRLYNVPNYNMKGTYQLILWIERDISCYKALASYVEWNSLKNYVSWQV